MEPIKVTEKKIKQYDIVFYTSFDKLNDHIKEVCPKATKCVIISDTNVSKIYLDELKSKISLPSAEYIFEAGEERKNMDTLQEILDFLYTQKLSRKDVVISLGGGVVSDMAGFASCIYMRGVNHVICPTSLLSMADASVGGKTAIDYKSKKNLIGAFNNPNLIYMNVSTLKSLPDRQYFAGFAEIMKAGLIQDQKFYTWLIEKMYEICEKDNDTLIQMLQTSINIKKSIVEKDPYEETGLRMLLNLGHTIGHGIESVLSDQYIHGECVALGCVAAAYISYKMDLISSDVYYEIRDMFVPFYLPISIETDRVQDIYNALTYDKKNSEGKIVMVLLNRIGKAFVSYEVPSELILEAINELNFKDED